MCRLVVWVAGALCCVGCGGPTGPGAIEPLKYDPAGMTAAALQQYDKNNNGSLEGAEIDASPALKAGLPFIDRNNDKKLSREELHQRFTQYAEFGAASVVAIHGELTFNGAPLRGAEIRFIPEKFMGPGFKPGLAVTSEEGVANVQLEGETRIGLPAGLYRMTISRMDGSGKETLPPQYNTKSTLGREVFDDGRSAGGSFQLNLTSTVK